MSLMRNLTNEIVNSLSLKIDGRYLPKWILNSDVEFDADFSNNRYYDGSEVVFPFTVSRNSPISYFNSDGDIATAGVDVPAFGYDPETLEPLGLLSFGQSTNIVPYSVSDSTNWTAAGSSLTDLSLNALGVFDGLAISTNGQLFANAYVGNISVTSGTTYTTTVFYREGTSGSIRFNLREDATGNQTLLAGSIGGSYTNVSSDAGTYTEIDDVLLADGLTRMFTAIYVPNFTGTMSFRVGPQSSTAGEDVISLGFQMEEGNIPTPYIPTSGATATRNTQSCIISGIENLTWFNNNEGTFYFEGRAPLNDGQFSILFNANIDATQTDDFIRGNINSSGYVQLRGEDSNIEQLNNQYTGEPKATGQDSFNVTFAYKENDFGAVYDGNLFTDASGVVPAPLDTLSIGASNAGGSVLNGFIKRFTYYKTRLSNNRLGVLSS
jgi:hypothetical protein